MIEDAQLKLKDHKLLSCNHVFCSILYIIYIFNVLFVCMCVYVLDRSGVKYTLSSTSTSTFIFHFTSTSTSVTFHGIQVPREYFIINIRPVPLGHIGM